MGKTQTQRFKPRKTANPPPKKSNGKKAPGVQRVYATRRRAASQPIKAENENQQATSSSSSSPEASDSTPEPSSSSPESSSSGPGTSSCSPVTSGSHPQSSTSCSSSSGETDVSGKEDGVSEASKQIKKKVTKRASLLSRVRNCYNVSMCSTVALSNLGQEDIAFLFEKSNYTLENDLDFCEFKLNELNERRDEIDLTRASDGIPSDSSIDPDSRLSFDSSPATGVQANESTSLVDFKRPVNFRSSIDFKGSVLVPYALSSDEEDT